MKIQEAIKIRKMEMLGDSEQMEYAKQMAIKALEKQTPQKPITETVKGVVRLNTPQRWPMDWKLSMRRTTNEHLTGQTGVNACTSTRHGRRA